MTTIGSIDTATNTSSLTESRNTIAENFDTFLGLLTTQLKNQNPLDPLDTNQFTSQMVEFTSVEQQLKTNEFLEALTLSNTANSYSESVSFIGKQVTASGSSSELINGSATWQFETSADAPNSIISIVDEAGNAVYSEELALGSGTGTFTWDGQDNSGNQMPEGTYSISVDARNAGTYVSSSTSTTGVVSAVELSGSEPVLVIGDTRISISDVTSVAQV